LEDRESDPFGGVNLETYGRRFGADSPGVEPCGHSRLTRGPRSSDRTAANAGGSAALRCDLRATRTKHSLQIEVHNVDRRAGRHVGIVLTKTVDVSLDRAFARKS